MFFASTDKTFILGGRLSTRLQLLQSKVKSLTKKLNDITVATSYLTSNELNNLDNEIFHCINQLKVSKKISNIDNI